MIFINKRFLSTYVKNLQKDHKVNVRKIKHDVDLIKRVMKIEKFEINVWIHSDKEVRELNKNMLGKDKETDILSFSEQDLKPKQKLIYSKDTKLLGNLVLGIGYIKKYCEKRNKNVYDYITRLLVHGICHLLGYDHIDINDRKIMRNREYYVLRKVREIKAIEQSEQNISNEKEEEDEELTEQSPVKKLNKKKKKKPLFKIHYVDPMLRDTVLGKRKKIKKP